MQNFDSKFFFYSVCVILKCAGQYSGQQTIAVVSETPVKPTSDVALAHLLHLLVRLRCVRGRDGFANPPGSYETHDDLVPNVNRLKTEGREVLVGRKIHGQRSVQQHVDVRDQIIGLFGAQNRCVVTCVRFCLVNLEVNEVESVRMYGKGKSISIMPVVGKGRVDVPVIGRIGQVDVFAATSKVKS